MAGVLQAADIARIDERCDHRHRARQVAPPVPMVTCVAVPDVCPAGTDCVQHRQRVL